MQMTVKSNGTRDRHRAAADAGVRLTESGSRKLNLPTQRSRRRLSQRATGLPWNFTFADAAQQIRVVDQQSLTHADR